MSFFKRSPWARCVLGLSLALAPLGANADDDEEEPPRVVRGSRPAFGGELPVDHGLFLASDGARLDAVLRVEDAVLPLSTTALAPCEGGGCVYVLRLDDAGLTPTADGTPAQVALNTNAGGLEVFDLVIHEAIGDASVPAIPSVTDVLIDDQRARELLSRELIGSYAVRVVLDEGSGAPAALVVHAGPSATTLSPARAILASPCAPCEGPIPTLDPSWSEVCVAVEAVGANGERSGLSGPRCEPIPPAGGGCSATSGQGGSIPGVLGLLALVLSRRAQRRR